MLRSSGYSRIQAVFAEFIGRIRLRICIGQDHVIKLKTFRKCKLYQKCTFLWQTVAFSNKLRCFISERPRNLFKAVTASANNRSESVFLFKLIYKRNKFLIILAIGITALYNNLFSRCNQYLR